MRLALRALRGRFGSDFLAAVSIVTAVLLQEYLAGAIVVLMLSAAKRSSGTPWRRPPRSCARSPGGSRRGRTARRGRSQDGSRIGKRSHVGEVAVGDEIVVLPHEICPVDGEVVDGHGSMDESYLTGEPFQISKGPGAAVLSGAINGDAALVVRATKVAADSRYARIMQVMQEAEQRRPALRRLGDQLGAWVHAARAGASPAPPGGRAAIRPVPERRRHRHAVSAAHRDPRGDHRRDLDGGAPRDHREGPGRARAADASAAP